MLKAHRNIGTFEDNRIIVSGRDSNFTYVKSACGILNINRFPMAIALPKHTYKKVTCKRCLKIMQK